MATLGAWDYTILAVVLIISVAIGIYYRFVGGKQSTTTEYLLADRSMGITPVAFSLMASFMSAITILGVSMENYQYGTMFVTDNNHIQPINPLQKWRIASDAKIVTNVASASSPPSFPTTKRTSSCVPRICAVGTRMMT